MTEDPTKESKSIQYLNYKEELKLRMEHYHAQDDLITIFLNAYKRKKQEFNSATKDLGLDLLSKDDQLKNIPSISLVHIEDIARKMGSCGYELLEGGYSKGVQKFYKYMPLRYQPFLDELFEFAFHRELETIQHQIENFLDGAHLSYDEINAMDLGEMEVSLSVAEKVAQGLYMPAFELIQREYILYAITKIRKYNPHRAFHRLHDLSETNKQIIMQYIRYIIQGDQMVTPGEISFIEQVIPKLKMEQFDEAKFKSSLTQTISEADLVPLAPPLMEPIRRQILGLVVDCAYSDKMLNDEEQPRILAIAKLIIGETYHNAN